MRTNASRVLPDARPGTMLAHFDRHFLGSRPRPAHADRVSGWSGSPGSVRHIRRNENPHVARGRRPVAWQEEVKTFYSLEVWYA